MGGQAGAGANGNLFGYSADPASNGSDGNSGAGGRRGLPGKVVEGLAKSIPPY